PAEPAATVQVDELRVDDLLDRRVPAEADLAHRHGQDAHAPGWDEGDSQLAVVHDDEVHTLLLAAVQRQLADRPGDGTAGRDLATVRLPRRHADVLACADEDFAEGLRPGGGGRGDAARERDEDGEALEHKSSFGVE